MEAPLEELADRSVMARALMYLLAAVGTAIVASVGIPNAPLHGEHAVPVLGGIAYVAAIGVFFGFERLPSWGIHALLIGVTVLIAWAVYASDEPGSAYKVFFFWVAIYAAFFFTPTGTALQIGAMLTAYGIALLELNDTTAAAAHNSKTLHWALTASALVLLAVAIQALTSRLARLVGRLTEIGRADQVTGLANAAAFTELLETEVERARRSGNRLGVVIGELDDFAPVASGPMPASQQQVLAAVASIFRDTSRQIDMSARLGGGRFAMLLPYTDEHGAYLLSERIHQRVAPLEAGRARMSFGVAGFPRSGASAEAVMHSAETALTEAREAGGDRVMVYQRSSSAGKIQIDAPLI